MKQSEKTTAETESKCRRRFWLVKERRVVESQFLQRVTQPFILVGFHGIETRKNHRLDLLKTREGHGCWILMAGDRVADFCVGYDLDVGVEESDFACRQPVQFFHLW